MSKVIFIMLLILAISTILAPHRIKRIMTFLDPWKYHNAEGYQLVQSYLALSYGHLLGRGLGKSQFKEFYLPEAHTDFIFSVIGEELGFVGSVGVIVAFVIFFFLVTKMAEGTESFYGSILIYGMALNIVLQAFVNVAVVCGLLPTKGLGLPFISYGGSSFTKEFIQRVNIIFTNKHLIQYIQRRQIARLYSYNNLHKIFLFKIYYILFRLEKKHFNWLNHTDSI